MIRNEKKQIIKRKIYINDAPYPLNNRHMYPSKNGQAILQNTEDNNIRNNNIPNKKGQGKFISNYPDQRQYPDEFFNQFYANLN